MKNWFQKSCGGCMFWVFMSMVLVATVFVLMSTIALTMITGLLTIFFNTFRDVLVTIAQSLGAVPAVLVWPAMIVLILGTIWAWWRYRQSWHWRSLDSLREEYEPLVRVLKKRGMQTYLIEINRLMNRIFLERDRVEELETLIHQELPKIEIRIKEISKQMRAPAPEGERKEMELLFDSLAQNSSKLREKKSALARFEMSKAQLASKMNCLRIQLNDIDHDDSEIKDILKSMDSVSFLADIFDREE